MKNNKVKNLRLQLQLTQRQFAKELGVTLLSVCNYESGKHIPHSLTMEKIIQLAKRYRIKLELSDLLEK